MNHQGDNGVTFRWIVSVIKTFQLNRLKSHLLLRVPQTLT